MIAWIEQANGLVLAMNLEQKIAQLFQDPNTGSLIIDKGAGATVGTEDTAKDQLLPG